jgi:endonuclease YncB( thermonuclease family)
MTRRNDIAPYERPEARRWTRVTDYVSDAQAHVGNVHWPRPGALPSLPPVADLQPKKRRGGLVLPVAAVALAALAALWGGGILGEREQSDSSAGATKSTGLVFGLCSQGGLTNCVQSGDSFYLGGKTVRIAGIEAPQLYGAACSKEAELGRASAVKLQLILNSGELELTKTGQDLDRYGLLLRNVSVDGASVARAMVTARLAREIGDSTRSWC